MKSEPDVGRLIESPGVDGHTPTFICGACVELCSGALKHAAQQGSEDTQTVRIAEAPAISGDDLGDAIAAAVKNLSDQEFRVIELRYGLADGYSYSHEEVGKQLQLPPERIAEIEAEAVAKLKPDSDSP
jgi:DNA-directed RNA polymerase sigma subunit (sigma70/sigma32)